MNSVHLWVDSLVVLHWIRNQKAWKQYVHNRVEEIRGLTSVGDWNFCPGELNSADLPSRGVNAKELVGNTLWWHGPSNITDQSNSQPLIPDIDVTCEVEAELSRSHATAIHAMITVNKKRKIICLDSLIGCTQYSKLDVVLRVTAYVLLFVARLKRHRTDGCERNSLIDAEDIKEAEAAWIISVQLNLIRMLQGVKPMQNPSWMPKMMKSTNGLLGYSASITHQLSTINGLMIFEASAGTLSLSAASRGCEVQPWIHSLYEGGLVVIRTLPSSFEVKAIGRV